MRKLLLAILALAPMIAVSIVETPCAAQQPAVVVPVPPPLETGALTHLEFGERQPCRSPAAVCDRVGRQWSEDRSASRRRDHIGAHEDPHHQGERPDLKSKVIAPDVLLQAHSASLQMTFYDGHQFPAESIALTRSRPSTAPGTARAAPATK